MKSRLLAASAALVTLSGCASSLAALPALPGSTSLAPPHAEIVEGQAVPVTAHPDQLALLRSGDARIAENKRLVHDMWRRLLNAGQTDEIGRYISPDYVQHSVVARPGRDALDQIVSINIPRRDVAPARIEEPVVTMIAEGDYVVLALVDERPEPSGSGSYTSTFFHLFRIADGRIVEHWDSAQRPAGLDVPAPGATSGPIPIGGVEGNAQLAMVESDDPALRANKRTVYDLWRQIPDAGREELTDLYLDPIYIQHNPNAATGSEGFRAYMANRPDTPIETHYRHPLVTMIAEGDMVVQVLSDVRPDPDRPGETYRIAWFDMFRLEDGRIVEHWDTASKGELRQD